MTAALLLLKKIWPYLLAAALLIAAWWWHGGQVDAVREAGRQIGRTEVQADWNEERTRLADAAAEANQANQTKKDSQDDAVHTATTDRAQTAQITATYLSDPRVLAERDGLRRDLRTALNTIRSCGDMSTAAENARAARAATLEAVLDDMEREGATVARSATGHAADSLMYQQAWPK